MGRHNMSEVASFHDQKKGDFDPETGIILGSRTPQYKKYLNLKESERIDQSVGEATKIEKHTLNLIDVINNIQIDSSSKDSIEQRRLLKQKKDQAKNLITEVLRKAKEYRDIIEQIEKISSKKNSLSTKDYQKEFENADARRQLKHNVVIDAINIANRFIVNHFGNIDEEIIEDWEEKEKGANRPVLRANRVDLPSNVLLPDSVEVSSRKQTEDWAKQLENIKI